MSHWGVITAGDVQAEQARTLSSAQTTNQSVQACTTMDATTKQEWATFYDSLVKWCNTPIVNLWTPWNPDNAVVVTGDTGDTMMAYEAQLQAWQKRIATICKNAAPEQAPFDPDPAGDKASQWVRWTAVIVGFAATAYTVGQVARLLPSARRTATPPAAAARTRREGRA